MPDRFHELPRLRSTKRRNFRKGIDAYRYAVQVWAHPPPEGAPQVIKLRTTVVALAVVALAAAGAIAVEDIGSAAPVALGVEDEGADCPVSLPGSLTSNSKLPDPFKKLDGSRITARSDWRCRREEIKKLAEKYVYGEKPAKPQSVTGTVSSSSITVNVTHNGRS